MTRTYMLWGMRNDFSYCESEEEVVREENVPFDKLNEHIQQLFNRPDVMWINVIQEEEENVTTSPLQS